MAKYSIRELEKLSGIKAHTIRIWEKRYHLIEPQRTSTNIRFYSDNDLKKIINVSQLNAQGIKISRIAEMPLEEIHRRITELSQDQREANVHIDQLVIAMVGLDEENFEKILSGLIFRFGFEETIVQIIYPFLDKIGILWQTRHIIPAQEHFISNLIRQKMIVATDALPLPPGTARRAMLFLPENELHELGLLFSNYRLRKAGTRTYYLGQAVPFDDLKSTYAIHKPQLLITSLTSAISKKTITRYIDDLAAEFKDSTILINGLQTTSISSPHRHVHILKTAYDLNPFLQG